jgi:hypothetical protein
MRQLQMLSALTVAAITLMAMLSGLVSTPAAHAAEGCTIADFQGSWGFSFNGTIVSPSQFSGPVAAAGQFTSDENGNLSGSDTLSLNGQIIPRTFIGTAIVAANCTGSATLTIQTPANFFPPFHLHFVLDDRAREARFVQADPGTVITGSARKFVASD